MSKQNQILILVFFSFAITFWVYGSSITLPFFFDDFVHYPFVEDQTFWQIWTSIDQLSYYRPVNFAIWRLTYLLAGSHNPIVDHGINLILHAANGALVGWLATRLWLSSKSHLQLLRGLLSCTLYILFPFSYQVIPWVGAMSHLLVTNLILWSVVTFLKWQQQNNRLWLVTSLLIAVMALFTHENGILIAPLILLILVTTPDSQKTNPEILRTGFLFSLPVLIWLPIRLNIHQGVGGQFFPNNLEGLLQNSAYFIQGATFPITQFGGWLYQSGWNDMITVAFLAGTSIILAALIQILCKDGTKRRWLPWFWWVLASLPAIVLLRVPYVIDGPRLLMTASVGISWLWADVLICTLTTHAKAASKRGRLVKQVLVSIFIIVTIIGSLRFIDARMKGHLILGKNFKEVINLTLNANSAGEKAVFINAPSWLAPTKKTFALGHEGVLFWPDYVPPESLLRVHTGMPGNLTWVRVDAIRPTIDGFYGVSGNPPEWNELAKHPTRFFAAQYEKTSITYKEVGAFQPSNSFTKPPLAFFAPQSAAEITLHAASIVAIQDYWRVTLTWSSSGPNPTATVFVHQVDATGSLINQADGMPLAGSYPFSIWQDGLTIIDHRYVDKSPGAVAINIGLYDWTTGEREKAVFQNNSPLPDNSLTLPLPSN